MVRGVEYEERLLGSSADVFRQEGDGKSQGEQVLCGRVKLW